MTRSLLFIAFSGVTTAHLAAQSKPAPAEVIPRVEPGLEEAVNWKWRVVPSEDKDWGLHLPEAPKPEAEQAQAPEMPNPTESRPNTYEVVKGDALILIAKRFSMTAQQIKAFNGLSSDTIKIGQVLKVPTLDELKTLTPPPPPADKAKETDAKLQTRPQPDPITDPLGQDDLLLQVFLDREQFSTGPIDGNLGPTFAIVSQRYRESHEDSQNMDAFQQKARNTVGSPFARYTLKAEDFRFIAPPTDESPGTGKKASRSKGKASAEGPPLAYDEMISAPQLVYRTAWEFVAERFHCDEAFLRTLNSRVKGSPAAGAEFQVPNVIPFEIEKAFEKPLQPVADAQKVVTAAVVELSRLEVAVGGRLVAVMPLALARPDLRGRGSWTVLDVIPRPRLATLREMKNETPKTPTGPAAGDAAPDPVPAPKAVLPSEQYLPEGPNNPVGIIWINLAKARNKDPLPYGLHGTSIPSRMKTQEGIGGIRLANWDIDRVVRLLPQGTPLQWK